MNDPYSGNELIYDSLNCQTLESTDRNHNHYHNHHLTM